METTTMILPEQINLGVNNDVIKRQEALDRQVKGAMFLDTLAQKDVIKNLTPEYNKLLSENTTMCNVLSAHQKARIKSIKAPVFPEELRKLGFKTSKFGIRTSFLGHEISYRVVIGNPGEHYVLEASKSFKLKPDAKTLELTKKIAENEKKLSEIRAKITDAQNKLAQRANRLADAQGMLALKSMTAEEKATVLQVQANLDSTKADKILKA